MIDKKEDYYIFEGYNHYTNKPLYRVQGNDENDNEYVGEWYLSKKNAQNELDKINNIQDNSHIEFDEELKRGGFIYEVQKKGSPSNDMRETMFSAKNLTQLKERIIEKYGTLENLIVSRRTNDGQYKYVKFDDGGKVADEIIDESPIEVADEIIDESPIEVADEITDNDVEILAPVENTNTNWESFFKNNPTKVLGTEKEVTTKFGKKVIRVIGDAEMLENLDLPIIDSHTDSENLTTIITDETTIDNISQTQIISLTKNNKKAKKEFVQTKKALQENKEYELFSFDEVDKEYNKGISDEVKSAYVYYLQKISNGNLKGGFLKYDLGFNDKVQKDLMSKGVLFYDSSEADFTRRFIPIFLWKSGNIYKKKQKLEENRDYYIETFGEKIYDIHLEQINEVYNLVWSRRLTLNNADIKNRLVINPTSKLAKDMNDFKIQSYMLGDYLVQSQYVGLSEAGGKETLLPLKDGGKDTKIYDYSLQLAFILYLKGIGGGEKAKEKGIIYTDGMGYQQIYYYYFKNSQKPKTYVDSKGETQEMTKELWARLKGYAIKNAKRLFAHFLEFGLLPKDRERLELQWNIEYNGNVEVKVTDVPIGFQFAKRYNGEFDIDIQPIKRKSLVFNMIKGSSLLAYGVGLGKTFCAIFNLAQNLEYGFCKRPLIILPNQVYPQFCKEIAGIIPQYKINYLYNLKGEYTLNQKIEDNTISVCTYEGLEEIGFTDNLQDAFFTRVVDILDSGENLSDKQKEKTAEKYRELIGKAQSETSVNYDDLDTNWDYLVVDEAHNFKKLFTSVKGQANQKDDEKVTEKTKNTYEKTEYSISSGTPSDRAIKLFFLTQYVQQKSFNGNILLLTATPFTNSPLEVFTMLSYLNYDYLKLIKLQNLKEFFDNFAIISVEVVINTQLEPVRQQVFTGWSNLVGLQDLIFKFMDKATKEEEEEAVKGKRPNKIVLPLNKKQINDVEYELADSDRISTTLALTDFQLSLWETLKDYARGDISTEDLQEEVNLTSCGKIAIKVKTKNENDVEVEKIEVAELDDKEKGGGVRALQCLTYGRQLAVSPYLYRYSGLQKEPTYLEYVQSSPKILYVMSCIKSVKNYHESKGTRISGQVIFLNIGTGCYNYIVEYLVKEVGFKENEVGIISGSNNRIAKKKYKSKSQVQDKFLGRFFNEQTMTFDKIDDSERVKVLIGSASIQEGINLQEYSSVLYNLYIGFNPTDQIQLEGRIWRQGNQFNNVRIVIPLMENSMDIFMFQKLQEKTQRINEIWARTGKNELDTTEFSAEELKYELITNPEDLARLTLDDDKYKIDEQISDINYEYSTIKNVAQIYFAIDGFYTDYNQIEYTYQINSYKLNPSNFFTNTRVGMMYLILKIYREDLVPLPLFVEDIENNVQLKTLTYGNFTPRQIEKRYLYTDKLLNYSVKEIIEKMVEFRKDNKIYVPIDYNYDILFPKKYEKGDSVTFNAKINSIDKKTKEETTTTKELTGVIKVINEDYSNNFLEVFVKGYEDLFDVSKDDIVEKKEKKERKEFYNIGTKEFTENLLPILYFQYQKDFSIITGVLQSNQYSENRYLYNKIFDVFRDVSRIKNSYTPITQLTTIQESFLKEYNDNIPTPDFWILMENNLYTLDINSLDNENNTIRKKDIYVGEYIKTFISVEKAERELLRPKGITSADELTSKLEELTLQIKEKEAEKVFINSNEYLQQKIAIINEKRQADKQNPLRKASNYIQRAKEFQSVNTEYKGNEYLDDIKIPKEKVQKEVIEEAVEVKSSSIDDKIKGLRIALKFAKGDSASLIEKKIKGFEIAKKMQKFKTGGSVVSKENSIKEFFKKFGFNVEDIQKDEYSNGIEGWIVFYDNKNKYRVIDYSVAMYLIVHDKTTNKTDIIKQSKSFNIDNFATGGGIENKNNVWYNVLKKFFEVFYGEYEENTAEDYIDESQVTSDEVKARGSNPYPYSWEFRNYSPLLSWKEAKDKFKNSLTKEELDSIQISFNSEDYADAEEHDTEKTYSTITIKKNENFKKGGGVSSWNTLTIEKIGKNFPYKLNALNEILQNAGEKRNGKIYDFSLDRQSNKYDTFAQFVYSASIILNDTGSDSVTPSGTYFSQKSLPIRFYLRLTIRKDGNNNPITINASKDVAGGMSIYKSIEVNSLYDIEKYINSILRDNPPNNLENMVYKDGGGITDALELLKNKIRSISKKMEYDGESGYGGYVVYINDILDKDKDKIKINTYTNLSPYSAQASDEVKVSFNAPNKTMIIFSTNVFERFEDNNSFEKYGGIKYIYEPLTNKIASEILEKIKL